MNHDYIVEENELLDAYEMDEGLVMLCECLREASRALGVKLTLANLLTVPDSLAAMCVFGAWMKRIGQN